MLKNIYEYPEYPYQKYVTEKEELPDDSYGSMNKLYVYSASLKWGVWSRFHWFNDREKHLKNINIY